MKEDHAMSTFQFQYGSIKSGMLLNIQVGYGEFQFQYGSIKRLLALRQVWQTFRFQFQYGSIKSFRSKMRGFW